MKWRLGVLLLSPEMILLILAMLLFSISLVFFLSTNRENNRTRTGVGKESTVFVNARKSDTRVAGVFYISPGVRRKLPYGNKTAEDIHQSKFKLDRYV